jgi:hypothetical protein
MRSDEVDATEEHRLRQAFEGLPKSRYWRTGAIAHLGRYGLTQEIVASTLEAPNDIALQTRRKGPRRAFFKYYPLDSHEIVGLEDANGGAWFRVVLDETDSLYTAFRDYFTEKEGGRPSCLTPTTRNNF